MLASFGTELVIVNRVESDYKQEIIDDMIAIIVHFSSRLYGKRRGRKKTTKLNRSSRILQISRGAGFAQMDNLRILRKQTFITHPRLNTVKKCIGI